MACFFFFVGLAVYLAGRMGRLGSLKANAVTCARMLAGLLSKKELLLTFPIMLIIAEAVLSGPGARASQSCRGDSDYSGTGCGVIRARGKSVSRTGECRSERHPEQVDQLL